MSRCRALQLGGDSPRDVPSLWPGLEAEGAAAVCEEQRAMAMISFELAMAFLWLPALLMIGSGIVLGIRWLRR